MAQQRQNMNPWGDAMGQAVGAMYKYYMSQPTAADQLKAQLMQEQLAQAPMQSEKMRIENMLNQRMYDAGVYPSMPASAQETEYYANQSPEKQEIFRRTKGGYSQADLGDVKAKFDPWTGEYTPQTTIGAAPRIEIKDGRVAKFPAIPSQPLSPAANLFSSVIQQESGGDPNAVSPKGATGIAQIMPSTASDPGYGVPNIFEMADQMGVPVPSYDEEGAKLLLGNSDLSKMFGQAYLNAMAGRHGGDVEKALASYNAGPSAVLQASATGGEDWLSAMPKETQNYVPQVLDRAGMSQQTSVGGPSDGIRLDGPAPAPIGTGQPSRNTGGVEVFDLAPAAEDVKREGLRKSREGLVTKNSNTNLLEIFPLLKSSVLPATGMGGQIARGLNITGGTDVKAIDRRLDQIKAAESIGALQQMREENKTGGAVGNVTPQELEILQKSRESIDTSTNEADFQLALMRYYNLRNDIVFRNDEGSPLNPNHPPYLPTPEAVANMTTRDELLNAIRPFGGEVPEFVKEIIEQRMTELGM